MERDGRLRRAAQARQVARAGGQVPEKLYDHVVSQDKSAREALQTFLAGRGDVLLSYENEAIFAQKHDQPIDYVIPKATIQIENPIAVVKTSSEQDRPRARSCSYLRTKPAQMIFAQNGYRPVLRSAAKGFGFPVRRSVFSISGSAAGRRSTSSSSTRATGS